MHIDLRNYEKGCIVETDAQDNSGQWDAIAGVVEDTKGFDSYKTAEVYVQWFNGAKGWYDVWDEEQIVGYRVLIRPSNRLRIYMREYDD